MKKIVVFIFLFILIPMGYVKADELNLAENAKAAIIIEASSGKILWEKNAHEKLAPASMTKIMSMLLIMENIESGNLSWDEKITASLNASSMGGSQIFLEPGEKMTVKDMLKGIAIGSGNDATVAMAERIAGTEAKFVEMMNNEARSLGATGTHFISPHGLHNENHYTTVYDIYLMLNEALTYPYFVETMQLGNYTISYQRGEETLTTRLDATDHYLTGEESAPNGVTVLGGKTGTTSAAGSCLAILSQNRYGEPYISIVMKALNKIYLYQDMNTLLAQINS